MAEWDAEEFDLEDAQRQVAGVADVRATLREVQLEQAEKLQTLLQRIGEGVKRTSAGTCRTRWSSN